MLTPANLPMTPNRSLLDVHEIHEVATLVATSSPISTRSSVDNISPTESLTPDSSLRSPSSSTPTVKFAPLPLIDPNRKRSLAPLGVPARSRRILAVQEDSGSLLWSRDLDLPEDMEDPIITLARFIKKTSKTLWQRVRKGSMKVVESEEDMSCSTEPVLDISSTERSGDVTMAEKGQAVWEAVGRENKRGRPASWSPPVECGTLGVDEAKRMSTTDLRSQSLSVVP